MVIQFGVKVYPPFSDILFIAQCTFHQIGNSYILLISYISYKLVFTILVKTYNMLVILIIGIVCSWPN